MLVKRGGQPTLGSCSAVCVVEELTALLVKNYQIPVGRLNEHPSAFLKITYVFNSSRHQTVKEWDCSSSRQNQTFPAFAKHQNAPHFLLFLLYHSDTTKPPSPTRRYWAFSLRDAAPLPTFHRVRRDRAVRRLVDATMLHLYMQVYPMYVAQRPEDAASLSNEQVSLALCGQHINAPPFMRCLPTF